MKHDALGRCGLGDGLAENRVHLTKPMQLAPEPSLHEHIPERHHIDRPFDGLVSAKEYEIVCAICCWNRFRRAWKSGAIQNDAQLVRTSKTNAKSVGHSA